MFCEILSKTIDRVIAVSESLDPGITYTELDFGYKLIVEAKSQETLLPIGHKILPPPLVFGVNAKILVKFEACKTCHPTDLVVVFNACVLGGRAIDEQSRKHEEKKCAYDHE